MKKLALIILSILFCQLLYAQCDSYHSSLRCRPSPQEAKDMVLSSQSRSAQLEANQNYRFQMTLFGNMDYRIIFCTQRRFYPIHYIITDKETGEVLYDNKDDDYVESFGVTIENTVSVYVDVILLAEGAKFRDFRQNRACFGLPILFRRVPRLGF